ncbi:DnaB-like helicase C-terminal domain-containing protein [Oceanobacillus longus]|uniref:DnaB-like helicase C-terminal domain-containing protein n=1 Tax=Oceanobacillus longus TaxID=930120 RepID=A0ABV8H2Y6_9BACI
MKNKRVLNKSGSGLYREDYYERDSKNNRMEVIISKHRNGPTGTVELAFEKEYGWFGDVGVGWQEDAS